MKFLTTRYPEFVIDRVTSGIPDAAPAAPDRLKIADKLQYLQDVIRNIVR